MIVDIDIGNSRIKWRQLQGLDAAVIAEGLAVDLAEFQAGWVSPVAVERVRVSCVRDAETLDQLVSWVKLNWQVNAEVARVVREYKGFRVNYADLTRLGVDRWLAMLAAYKDSGSACTVVDCGTALTVDMVDAAGRHRGGYIVPGLELGPAALTRSTGIRLAQTSRTYSLSAGNATEEAVYNGTLAMLVALIEKSVKQEMAQSSGGSDYTVYITGGDADLISRHLTLPGSQVSLSPTLVFDGLAVALP